MMSTLAFEQFLAEPIATYSGQFPTGRNAAPISSSEPSAVEIRPWALRGMRPARQQGDPIRDAFSYDHKLQIAVTRDGAPLTISNATATKNTNNDGDEGPSEDYTYDYCPDSPEAH
jgi:putative ATP-grasp target RiPP